MGISRRRSQSRLPAGLGAPPPRRLSPARTSISRRSFSVMGLAARFRWMSQQFRVLLEAIGSIADPFAHIRGIDLAQSAAAASAHRWKRGRQQRRKHMTQRSMRKMAIAISTFACAALLSFTWSEQRGVLLSVESAQARVGRPLTPVSVAGVARRQTRRAVYGAGLAGAAVVGTAAAVASAPYYGGGYYSGGPYQGAGYYAGGPYASFGGYAPQDYATRNGFTCRPGTMVKLEDGRQHLCQ